MESRYRIFHLQAFQKDFSILSAQWTSLYAGVPSPLQMMELYLRHIRNVTAGIVRPAAGMGGEISLHVAGTTIALLSFARPASENGGCVTLAITGGILSGRSRSRASISFRTRRRRKNRIAIVLSGYHPAISGTRPGRVRRALYRWTQGWIHRVVTVSFLRTLVKETTAATDILVVRIARGGIPA